jgi:hypothetical protein
MLADILDRCLKEVQAEQKVIQAPVPQVPAPVKDSPNAPTDKQLSFFHALVKGKQLTDDQRQKLLASLPALDKRSITTTIQWLVGLPWVPRPFIPRPANRSNVPPDVKACLKEGYYAINDPTDSVLKFYQVQTPKNGKWEGFVFLKQVSGENKFGVKDRVERERIFGLIAKDPLEALKRFGREIGRCGHCSKQLTDQESRDIGIGPVCRKVLGV